ncbi:hypothetical protein GGI25_003308 [Coemansia spiralis]|uniref:N-acetyltransferase domain-containing protein n=2 Tax=Coemansia TaxID=4863 RepID=A0A9W8G6M9_9FUNG|nr:acyl-CoA N-acyltransferase [Coemansia spiralis]KAJ1992804.1 hypothetical protein EDC05_002588 [Coemansia umbellata]KAJ2622538.1 hypothetical protein GGI26_003137 [Coemansia sp. RSA 1358]KAJ2677088.1 hypothetical protein GGI25_003308 [Coemansia spiralis]
MTPEMFLIHPASPAEFKEAIQVRIHVFVKIQKIPLNEENNEDDKDALHMVVVDALQNKVVGTLRVMHLGSTARISRVAILPEYHGRGLGKKLLESTEKYIAGCARFSQCVETILGSLFDKCRFYERCGYVAKGDVTIEHGCPLIWMNKAIKHAL